MWRYTSILLIPTPKKKVSNGASIIGNPLLNFFAEVQDCKMRATWAARWLNCRLLLGTQQPSCGSHSFTISAAAPAWESRRAFSQTKRSCSAAQEA